MFESFERDAQRHSSSNQQAISIQTRAKGKSCFSFGNKSGSTFYGFFPGLGLHTLHQVLPKLALDYLLAKRPRAFYIPGRLCRLSHYRILFSSYFRHFAAGWEGCSEWKDTWTFLKQTKCWRHYDNTVKCPKITLPIYHLELCKRMSNCLQAFVCSRWTLAQWVDSVYVLNRSCLVWSHGLLACRKVRLLSTKSQCRVQQWLLKHHIINIK